MKDNYVIMMKSHSPLICSEKAVDNFPFETKNKNRTQSPAADPDSPCGIGHTMCAIRSKHDI